MIVLIGYDDDGHLTPYALEEFADRKTPGMFIHAQMADQIISAVLEGRSLLQFLPDWADNLWIWSWAVSGGVVVWRWQLSRNWWLVILTTIGVLCLFCWGSLLLAYWIPLVPAVLALLTTSGLMSLALRIQRSDKFVTSTLKSV